MTEEEAEFLYELKERFWLEFSILCNRYILEAQQHYPLLVDDATMMLGEMTSIYGRHT